MWRRAAILLLISSAAVSSHASILRGRVKDSTTSLPIAGANVEASLPQGFSPTIAVNATTDAEGKYQIDFPEPAGVFVTVSADGYGTVNGSASLGDAPVTENFSLVKLGSIGGNVRGSSAQPLSGISMSLFDASTKAVLSNVLTDDSGNYTFTDVAVGAYGVCVVDPSDIYLDACYNNRTIGANGVIHFDDVNVAVGAHVKNINLTLTEGATIRGTLRDTYFNVPIASVTVTMTVYSPAGQKLHSLDVSTDASGNYVISGVAVGNYFISAYALDFLPNSYYPETLYGSGECDPTCSFASNALISVTSSSKTGIDIGMIPGHFVSGRVTDAATSLPIGNVIVEAGEQACEFNYCVTARATTDSNGVYTLAHIVDSSPGTVRVRTAQAASYIDQVWANTPCSPLADCIRGGPGTTLTFSSAHDLVEHVDFALQSGASISGHVSWLERPDLPLSNVFVELFYIDMYGETLPIQEVYADSNGDYETDGWLPGTYFATATAFGDNQYGCTTYASTRYCDGTPAFSGTPIVLTTGQHQAGIDFQVSIDEIFNSGFQ
jgi:hypothetical protein